MRCEDVIPEIAPLLSGDVAREREPLLLEHLSACADCQAEADRLRELWLQLGTLDVEPPDSARMRQRLLMAVETFQTGVDQTRVESLDRAARAAGAGAASSAAWTPVTFGWLAGLAATLVIGVLLGRESVSQTIPAPAAAPAGPELVALRQELHDTREMVSLALLRQSSASERLRGVSWTERIDNPGNDVVSALLDTLAHDPNVNVRLAAIETLGRFADRPGVRSGAVDALTNSTAAPLVQVALIDLLVQIKEPSSRDSLQRLVTDERTDQAVRDRARQALQQLGRL